MTVRVTFDSNVWEKIFNPTDAECQPIREVLASRRMHGFICEAAFRIEAVRKNERENYFGQSHFGSRFEGTKLRDGKSYVAISLGPSDEHHPGLPGQQTEKLQRALGSGIQLMRGMNWMWVPCPPEIRDPALFIKERADERPEREQRQMDVFHLIQGRGVGLGVMDALGGFDVPITNKGDANKYQKACAEWADGELVAAHIAYKNDILCTNDHARSAGNSILNIENRDWLVAQYGVVFKTIGELIAKIAK